MSMQFESAGEVWHLLDQMGSDIVSKAGDEIRRTALGGPVQKRRDYPATAYQDQIEKNAVYLREATQALSMAMFNYLWLGQPILSEAEIPDFLTRTRVDPAHRDAALHLSYIRFGCSGCDAHAGHDNYAELRKLLQAGNLPKYIQEMESAYILHQGTTMVAGNYLSILLRNNHLAGCAHALDILEVGKIIGHHVYYWTHMCVGDFRNGR